MSKPVSRMSCNRARATTFLILLSVCIHPSQGRAAENLEKLDTVYNQATRNVVPIIELQSTCTLGAIKPRQSFSTLGTGFFVLRDTGEQLSTWLVTARHVVDSRLDLIAKTTISNGEAFLILPQNKWVFHPARIQRISSQLM